METIMDKMTKGQFQKNQIPWNKGMKGVHFSKKTEFKVGMIPWNKGTEKAPQLSGVNHWNWKGGIVRICECGKPKSTSSRNFRNKCKECGLKTLSRKMMGNKNGIGHITTPEARRKMSIARINIPRKVFKDTKIELIMGELLSKYQIPHEKQVALCQVTIADFFLEKYQLAIFCDGCYWHGCKLHRSIDKSIMLNKRQNRVLRQSGISVMRFWEHDIHGQPERCIQKIINFINFKLQ